MRFRFSGYQFGFLLSVLLFLSSFIQILSAGRDATFFLTDPDVAYTANGLSYLIDGRTYYTAHPGVQTAQLIALGNLPLKLYQGVFEPTISFKDWVFLNFDLVLAYNRIFQSMILGAGLFIFLASIFYLTHSYLWILFTWLALLAYSHLPTFGVTVINENTSFLILSLWAGAFALYQQTKKESWLFWLSVIAGISISNKFTNVSLCLVTLILAFTSRPNIRASFLRALTHSIIIAISFIAGFWPLKQMFGSVWNWAISLVTHSGMYGSGELEVFNAGKLWQTFMELLAANLTAFFVIAVNIVLISFSLIISKQERLRKAGLLLGLLVVIGYFSKFPMMRYQMTNYLLFILFGAAYLKNFGGFITGILKLLILVFISFHLGAAALANVKYQNNRIQDHIEITRRLETFIKGHPSQKATVWECCRSKDFGYLYADSWAGGFFKDELKKFTPNLFTFENSSFENVWQNHDPQPTFGLCWDHLYIQNTILPQFLQKYPDRNFEIIPIKDTENTLVISHHCTE
jgi:hypothetical protein